MSGTEDETKLLPAAIPGFPRGKHEIILADPPWNYKDKANAGKRGASHKYMTQSDNWIKNLPVEKIAADDAVLFLWVTMPFLPVGLEVMESWGFKFKTNAFTWVKTTKDGKGVKWGMGNWTRSNAELCLLGVRGKPKRVDAGVHSLVLTTPGKHSEKPKEVHDRIVKLMGPLKRVELFARRREPGWKCWGNEV